MSDTSVTQLRIDTETFGKAKILAAIFDESFNSFVKRALLSEIQRYESEHGELPKPLPVEK